VEVAWRVPRPEVVADVTADVTLAEGQARVQERLVFPTAPPPVRVLFWVPEAINLDRVRVDPGRARAVPAADGDPPARTKPGFRALLADVTVTLDAEHPLTLDWSFSLPDPDPVTHVRRFDVPLIVPDLATLVETRLRVWSQPGARPVLASGAAWEEYSEQGDRPALPALCLRGRRPDQPPVLSLSESVGIWQATASVEHALVQATVEDGGTQRYTARFLLSHLPTAHLDVQLPGPPGALGLKVYLAGESQDPGLEVRWSVVTDNRQPIEGSKVVRLEIPEEVAARRFSLALSYQIPAERVQRESTGLLWTVLIPPQLRGDLGRFPVRFQVHLPTAWVPIYPEGGLDFEQSWGWRGWLLGPHPALGDTDLERWFWSDQDRREAGGRRLEEAKGSPESSSANLQPAGADPASLVCRSSSLGSLCVYHVPQTAWLLLCSGTLVALGLGLYLLSFAFGRLSADGGAAASELRLPARLFWPLLVTLGLLLVIAILLWPGVLGPVLYGAEPGGLVLLFVLVFEGMRHQRYRRRVVFLPGFKRMKPGSSLSRAGSSATSGRPSAPAPRGEPSTVDSPPAPE
jgi:hypothetical protein